MQEAMITQSPQQVATMTTETRLLSTSEAAQRLNVHEQTLRTWVRKGEGPRAIRLSANRVKYRVSDLDAFIESKAS